jgi:hypothetical protein
MTTFLMDKYVIKDFLGMVIYLHKRNVFGIDLLNLIKKRFQYKRKYFISLVNFK